MLYTYTNTTHDHIELTEKEVKKKESVDKLTNVTAVHNNMQKQVQDIQSSNTKLEHNNMNLKEIISIAVR